MALFLVLGFLLLALNFLCLAAALVYVARCLDELQALANVQRVRDRRANAIVR